MGELCCRQEIHIPVAAYGSAADIGVPGHLGSWEVGEAPTVPWLPSAWVPTVPALSWSSLAAHSPLSCSEAVPDLCQHCLHCLWNTWLWCQNVLLRILTHIQVRWERHFLLFQPRDLRIWFYSYKSGCFFPYFFSPSSPDVHQNWSMSRDPAQSQAFRAESQDIDPAASRPHHFAETSFHPQETHKQRKWTLFLLSAVHTSSRAARLWPSGFHYD